MLVMGGHSGPANGMDLKTTNAMLGRVRNMSGGSTGSMESDLSRSWGSSTTTGSFDVFRASDAAMSINHLNNITATSGNMPHSIIESSADFTAAATAPRSSLSSSSSSSSSSSQQQSHQKQVVNPGRYKTEMCRPFNETGHCKYGEKCQFAHGGNEMRGIPRHPKYKTELCRTFHSSGFCPYGPRCHFIHSEDEYKLVEISQMKKQQAAQQVAKDVAQQASYLQAQHQALQAQISMVLSQVQSQITTQTAVTNPTVYPQLTSEQGAQIPTAAQFILGSTADTPPESPVGSPTEDVFQPHQLQMPLTAAHPAVMQSDLYSPLSPNIPAFPVQIPTQVPQQQTTAAVSPNTALMQHQQLLNQQNNNSSGGGNLDNLSSIMGGLALEQPTNSFLPPQFSSQSAMPLLNIPPQVLQDPTPPSSPDSLCSSMDSNRGSRLPVFSKLAGERS